MTNPAVGDIWEWTSEQWDDNTSVYIVKSCTILVLTEPLLHKGVFGAYNWDRWTFQALELDGDDAGVIEEWTFYDEHRDQWRQLA